MVILSLAPRSAGAVFGVVSTFAPARSPVTFATVVTGNGSPATADVRTAVVVPVKVIPLIANAAA